MQQYNQMANRVKRRRFWQYSFKTIVKKGNLKIAKRLFNQNSKILYYKDGSHFIDTIVYGDNG